MAPPPRPLPGDFIPDILLRLPPDDPAGLVRASAVCKSWRRTITDPAFHGRYRALHPTAAVLGFLHRPSDPELPRFVSTTSFHAAAADRRQHPLDCRHGRAVLYDYGNAVSHSGVIGGYVVWDPVTGDLHEVPDALGDDYLPHAAVVCASAAAACDHRGCSRGPFIVAFVGIERLVEMDDIHSDDDDDDDDEASNDDEDDDEDHYFDAHACFYASDTGEVAGNIDVHLGQGRYGLDDRPAALVGDSLYFLCTPAGILRYRYGLLRRLGGRGGAMDRMSAGIRDADVLSMMELPRGEHLGIVVGKNTDVTVMEAEGGGLGLAYLCPNKTGDMLYLLARETEATAAGDDDAGRWVQRRAIDLKALLPIGNDPGIKPCLRGIAQDANVIFVSTRDGVFIIDHGRSSLQVRKVCETGAVDRWIYPFESFYTESLLLKLASSKLPAPVGNQ